PPPLFVLERLLVRHKQCLKVRIGLHQLSLLSIDRRSDVVHSSTLLPPPILPILREHFAELPKTLLPNQCRSESEKALWGFQIFPNNPSANYMIYSFCVFTY